MATTITSNYTGEQLWTIFVRTNWYGQATVEYIKSGVVNGTMIDFQYRIYGPVYDHKEARRVEFVKPNSYGDPQTKTILEPGSGLTVLPAPLESYTMDQCIGFCKQYYYTMVKESLYMARKTNIVDPFTLDLDFDVYKNNLFARRECRRFKIERNPEYQPYVSFMGEPGSGLTTPIFTDTVTEVGSAPGAATGQPIPTQFLHTSPVLKGAFDIKDGIYYLTYHPNIVQHGENSTRLELIGSNTGDNVFFIRFSALGGGSYQYLRGISCTGISWTTVAPTVASRKSYEWILTDGPNPSWYFISPAVCPSSFLQTKYWENYAWGNRPVVKALEFVSVQ